jgi:hypothetical protein
MCWRSDVPLNCITAEEDVKVYKIFQKDINKGQLLSPFYYFKWEIGKLYIVNNFYDYPSTIIHRGLKTIPIRRFGYWWVKYKNFPLLKDSCHFVCVCEIPKGSIYFENEYKEVVSNKLIVKYVLDV